MATLILLAYLLHTLLDLMDDKFCPASSEAAFTQAFV